MALCKKKWIAGVMAGMMVFSSMATVAFGANILYDQVTQETVTKGVTYEKNHRLTEEGWQDIHVLKMDMTNPYLSFSTVESATEYGKKDTVLKMLQDTGALAGVNSDFFGLKGEYSASFGPVFKDGTFAAAGTDKNLSKNEYATLFMDKEGNPFVDFFRLKAEFYGNGVSKIELASINKITEMIWPICLNSNAAKTTADLDKRFPNLVKFVVENNYITKISAKGETVPVPENGYLIVMSDTYYDGIAQYFAVGQTAELRLQPSIGLDRIQTSVSGAGILLKDGQQPQDKGLVIGGRQPRTAIGTSQDGNTLILMVVDGRGTSIGATHDEMVWLMKEYGAYNAIHLDGGGSSTMVAKTVEKENLQVKNTVSEGSQRKVMSSVGLFTTAPVGEVNQIVIQKGTDKIFAGGSVDFKVVGYDENYHKIEIPQSEVVFEMTGGEGTLENNRLTAGTVGEYFITARWKDMTALTNVTSMKLATIAPNQRTHKVSGVGGTSPLNVYGVSTEGFVGTVPNPTYTLSDDTLGTISSGVFTAQKAGSGYAKVSFGEIHSYIAIQVGNTGAVSLPADTKYQDEKMKTVSKAQDGAYYINMVGRVSSGTVSDKVLYDKERERIAKAMEQNTDLAAFVGKNDVSRALAADTIRWSAGYQVYEKQNTSIVQLTASKGGLRSTSASQWIALKNNALTSQNQNVIFIMDKTPSDFTDAMETILFRSVLEEIRKAGKNVFVVSSSGTGYWTNAKEGVRYINLPELWTADGKQNPNFRMLKFRIIGDDISYEMVKP